MRFYEALDARKQFSAMLSSLQIRPDRMANTR
jgi:hypothetical protein